MTPEEIFKKLQAEFGEQVVFDFHDGTQGDKDAWFQIEPYSIEEVCTKLKTDHELHFDYLECITGIDFPDDKKIAVVYHVYSYEEKHRVVLKCFLDRDDPALPTVSNVWRTANWQERECFDLLGVLFDGHPDLRRLLLPTIGKATRCARTTRKPTTTTASRPFARTRSSSSPSSSPIKRPHPPPLPLTGEGSSPPLFLRAKRSSNHD